MTTQFPSNIDTFVNPGPRDAQNTISHSQQHVNVNDSVTAIEQYIGVQNSTDKNSLSYKINASIQQTFINPSASSAFTSATDLKQGNIVYISGPSNVSLASNDTDAHSNAIGMIFADVKAGQPCEVVNNIGVTKPDWTLIAGTATLKQNSTYYLDQNGMVSLNPTGAFDLPVGNAISPTCLFVSINLSDKVAL